MKNPARRGWIFACAVGAFFSVSVNAAESPSVAIVSRLAPNETTGREIRIPYGSFENRQLATRVLKQAKAEAAKLGIAKLVVVTPVVGAPGRGTGNTLSTAPSGGTISIPSGTGYVAGELVAREVITR